ncbi:pleiotropic drug resistance protein 1 [Cannabis sativa]|uniref:ABC transporter domain-containing protein n=1 Tax=Cannabis sativa TaxID=3483 RepID=A0A803QFC8_CANSA|nr:pleiotropic drug resistance protein 1 [Cannabis sativa]
MDSFGKRVKEDDDEETLKWAALERLPTYKRLRKGILNTCTIDVHHLSIQQKQSLVETLVKVPEEYNQTFLTKLKNRIDSVGIELPTVEVRFEHLNVETDIYVGERALPSFINFTTNVIEGFLNYLHIIPSKKKKIAILDGLSGIIKPCRMTLLLGPPSSGKTTFLLALAGQLDPRLKFCGKVTYNGHGLDEFIPERTAAYVSEHDYHIKEMTVRETLDFSARCQGVTRRYELLAELSRREKEANIKPDPDIDVFMKAAATEGQETSVVTEYVLKILGLDVCANTIIGDDLIRGISGGQRKRVTTGEMLVGPTAVMFMDEISTGLDSSTTYQIMNSMKQIVHILNETAVISLLQPAPETYNLFDDIILLSEGQIVYQGPREHVLEFFETVGFKCPERKAVADFLQEVTSKKDQEQYWAREEECYRFITVNDFVEAFQSFHVGQRMKDELLAPFDRSKNHPAALATRKYGVESKKEILKAVFCREWLLMKRNYFFYIFRLIKILIVALVVSTVFLRTEMHHGTIEDGIIYSGALFFIVVMFVFNGMSEIPMTIQKLPVFYKQRDLNFYPAWAYALFTWILKIPIACLEVLIWVAITYYLIGLDPSVASFFKQGLLLIFVNQMGSALFQAIAATSRNLIVADTFGSFVLLMLFGLGGFLLSKNDIKKWWIWGYWSSPLMYYQSAIQVNEFLSDQWSHPEPNGTRHLGIAVLESQGFFTKPYWYWIGFGAVVGYTIAFNVLYALSLTFLNQFGKSHSIVLLEDSDNQNAESSTEEMNQNRNTGMVLPFEPHWITFKDIVYSVDMPQEMKNQGIEDDKLILLKELSGVFRPGVLTALMGVSGAGKTTLMDVLAGRKTKGYIKGDIKISGYPKKQETFSRILGYCEQNDIHSPHVTIYESLIYSAWLRLPTEVDTKTREMFIEEVMELTELNVIRHALVGLPGVNGLSTEQRKRLTIAVELVANPSIIFMDEPTSGLDARAAAIVMRAVRNAVNTGRTIVCTIHQPSLDIFEAFDELFLMKCGGEEIYAGPLGHHCSNLIQYFESIEGVNKIKDGYNPATWMLEVTSSAQETALGIDFAHIFKTSDLFKRNRELIDDLSVPNPGSKDLHFSTQYATTFPTQCIACLWKQRWSYWRNAPYTCVRFFFTLFVALMFGTLFWDLGGKRTTQKDLLNAMGSMYAAVFFIGVHNGSSVRKVVAIERTVYYREKAAGMYSAFPYVFAQVMIEIPYIFSQAMVYSIIVYAMIGFEWSVGKFLWYLFFTTFAMFYFTFYGMMVVAATPDLDVATTVSSAFYGLWNLFSGFIIPYSRIPVWWKWYYWTCPVAWTMYGMLVSQYGDVTEKFDGTEETVKEFVERFFGYKHDFLGIVAFVNVVFAVAFPVIFSLLIKAFNFQKR